MKKIMIALIALVGVLSFASCSKDKATATVEITVTKSSKAIAGETVYQFSSQTWTQDESFRKPLHARRSSVTNENGVAVFELKEAFDLDIINDQTTLYYATFGEKDVLTGKTAVTVKKGETKKATIQQ